MPISRPNTHEQTGLRPVRPSRLSCPGHRVLNRVFTHRAAYRLRLQQVHDQVPRFLGQQGEADLPNSRRAQHNAKFWWRRKDSNLRAVKTRFTGGRHRPTRPHLRKLTNMERLEGVKPSTPWFVAKCSIR